MSTVLKHANVSIPCAILLDFPWMLHSSVHSSVHCIFWLSTIHFIPLFPVCLYATPLPPVQVQVVNQVPSWQGGKHCHSCQTGVSWSSTHPSPPGPLTQCKGWCGSGLGLESTSSLLNWQQHSHWRNVLYYWYRLFSSVNYCFITVRCCVAS